MPKPLVVIPTFLRTDLDAEVTATAIRSVHETAGDSVDLMICDDASPNQDALSTLFDETRKLGLGSFLIQVNKENSGFSTTVNLGLKLALEEGRDAVLLNADMEITTPGWLNHFRATGDDEGNHAAVAGALLTYPNGLIQHAGVYFSLLTRTFDHFYKYAPENLPEALERRVCPVTAAFQFIRHSTLEKVGIYDEGFKMGWEDMDYCIRVFLAGEKCVYNPNVRGIHHEMMFRGRPDPKIAEWQDKSFMYLVEKYREQSFAEFVPFW